jgi:flagellar biosynthesis chaperone FliJ
MGADKIPPSSIEHLHGPEEVPYGEDELVVVCIVRDGRPYVKSFVEHYFSLGVKHVVLLDNGSSDGTVSAARSYENVTILQTKLPFEDYADSLKQYLIFRFGRGRWILYADMDELFDYPYSHVVDLSSLLKYLTEKSYTAVGAHMLDMFPEEPLSGRAGTLDEPLKERHRFYDISNINRKSIKEIRNLPDNILRGGVRRTVYGATTLLTDRNNTLESDEVEVFSGGIRETIFGNTALLTKFPLVFLDGKVKPMNDSEHWVDNAKIADLTCVLYHYKFLDGYFHDQAAQVAQAAQALQEGQYGRDSARYKKYLEVLERNPALQVKQETARELKSVDDLIEDGFLVVPEDYMMLVYEEERKGGAGHGSGGEPGGLEAEAAFYRARAQAAVQSLRVRRLERHLEQLRKQNQRQVEKLATKLAKARKKNRNLTYQLRSIEASRSWRLLNELARLRARVASRKR